MLHHLVSRFLRQSRKSPRPANAAESTRRRPLRTSALSVESLESRRVMTGDFNGDGFDDLAVGVPQEDVMGIPNAGQVIITYGTAAGLDGVVNQPLTENLLGGVLNADDNFGASLEIGDYNGDGYDDLAISVVGEDFGAATEAGKIIVVYGSAAGLNPASAVTFAQGMGGLGEVAEIGDKFGWAMATGDYDGDGYEDLAVGASLEDIGPNIDTGVVHVIYGSAAGLTTAGSTIWTQNSGLVAEISETGDVFGATLVSGDFDGDTYDDLAIGVPGESVGLIIEAGAVNVLYGTAGGITDLNNQLFSQNSVGIAEVSEFQDHFGDALSSGDYDANGRDDLAIGVPTEDLAFADAGGVHIIYGVSAVFGLGAAGNQFFSQNSVGIADFEEAGDFFGSTLTSADFDGDGDDDLAIAAMFEDLGPAIDAGVVHVLYGIAGAGIRTGGAQIWQQGLGLVAGAPNLGDTFGRSLGAGDYNGDGRADLAIGIPGEDSGGVLDSGAVEVLYGALGGLTDVGSQLWDESLLGGILNLGDSFGWAVGRRR
ncbi:MAG: FG-GAP repeat protein [Pirellulales bacterium]